MRSHANNHQSTRRLDGEWPGRSAPLRASSHRAPQPLPWPARNASAGVGAQIERARSDAVIRVDGVKVALSNLDAELWPARPGRRALTKRDLLLYLSTAAADMLPHLRDRPLPLVRYPYGIRGGRLVQRRFDQPPPDYVDAITAPCEQGQGDQNYVICNSLPTLLWLGEMAVLELRGTLSRLAPGTDCGSPSSRCPSPIGSPPISLLDYPEFMLFELDPCVVSDDELHAATPQLWREGFARCRRVAFWLKEVLDSLSLSSFVKTSGAMGLHVYVPLLRQFDHEDVRALARIIAQSLLGEHPNDLTIEWPAVSRAGKVFLDYKANARARIPVAPYSPRALPHATVSVPLAWEELDEVCPTDFTILSVPGRLANRGDPWSEILDAKQDLMAMG
mgnify:CR=1 FL=1